MPLLPQPGDHHFHDHLIRFADGFAVTLRLTLIPPSVLEEIDAAGEKRAREAERVDSEGVPQVLVGDVIADYVDAGISGFYTSENSDLIDWTPAHTLEMCEGPDKWPNGILTDLYWSIIRFSATGRSADPKAGSPPNADAG